MNADRLRKIVAVSVLPGLGWLAFLYLISWRVTRRHKLAPAQMRSPSEYGLAYEDVAFPACDGVTLRGWWIPAPGADRTVIFLHGHAGSMDPDVQYAPDFHAAGFNVLMFDFRAHGRSDGRLSAVGCLEWKDALGAVDFVQARATDRIGLLGLSMGGVVAMLTAPVCPTVRAVVSDGGPARLWTALAGWGIERGVPRWLAEVVAWPTVAMASLRLGINLFRYEPVRWVGHIAPRPILLIHGDLDPFLTLPELNRLVAAAGAPEVWRVPDAGHRTVDERYPAEWRRRVIAFFDQHV